MLRGKCIQDASALFVIYESTRDSEPVRNRLWWPVDIGRSIGAHRLAGREVTASHSSDPFRIAPEDPDFWSLKSFTAYVAPRAEAAKVESEPVPCPKVRTGIQTRWYQGRWQKLLKSGWIDLVTT